MTANDNPKPSPTRYSASAKWLHWSIAAAVLLLLPLGPLMKRWTPEGLLRDRMYSFHEALGALVLLAMVARLGRRMIFGVPAPEATLTPLDRTASLTSQYVLYIMLFIAPLLGWAGTNAYGEAVNVFGLFSLPWILGKNVPLSEEIFDWHLAGGIVIATVVAIHVAGALFHRYVKRDGVFARMWPSVRPNPNTHSSEP
jgi:cytochrome b561